MKKSLFLFIILSCKLLIAESNLRSNYQTYNYFSTFENQFSWRYKPTADYILLFDTNYSNSSNSSFKRSTENMTYNYVLTYDKYKIKPYMVYNYSSYYNSGLPEDSVSINDKKMDKSGLGYQALFMGNKLLIQQNGNYLKLSNPQTDYFGWNSDSRISFSNQDRYNRFNISYYYANQDINLDRNSSQGLDLSYVFTAPPLRATPPLPPLKEGGEPPPSMRGGRGGVNLRGGRGGVTLRELQNSFQIHLKYDNYIKDLYSYNTLEDKSRRDEYLGNIAFNYHLTDNFEWVVSNRANFRDLNYLENTRRDSWAFENELNNQVNYKMDSSVYFAKLRLSNNERFTKSIDKNRPDQKYEAIEKKFSYGASWKFFFADTLRAEVSNSILQHYNSGSSNTMDNDIVMTIYEVYSSHKYKDHIFQNLMQIYQGQQVYLHHSLSAYNHEKISYLWQPEADLYLYEPFRILNKYRISADYEYYDRTDFISDRFYRMFYGEWGLLFSDKNDFTFYLPNSIKKHNLEVYLAFALENIMSAEKTEDTWFQNSSQYQRHYFMIFDYERKTYNLRLQPTIKYFNHTFESEVMTNFTLFLQNFEVYTSINPVGKQFNKMIWKFSLGVDYRF